MFSLIAWLFITLPVTLLAVPYSPLTWLTALIVSAGVAMPYGWLTRYALERPLPTLRRGLVQGIALGHASTGALLLTAPLALTAFAPSRPLWAVVAAAVLLCFGVWSAVSVRVKTLTINTPKLTRAHRVVQLTDVHLGSRRKRVLASALDTAQALQPDIIVITGDLVDGGEVGTEELASLAQCDTPVYMVIGNHERYVQLDTLLDAIGAQGVTLLRDQTAQHGELKLVGVDDSDAPHYLKHTLPTLETGPTDFTVLLYHKPDDWDAAVEADVDLMLSGHTHAGQVWPFSFLVKRRHPHWHGLYQHGTQALYVAPGTGCWGPIYRIGTRSEITVFDLTPDE